METHVGETYTGIPEDVRTVVLRCLDCRWFIANSDGLARELMRMHETECGLILKKEGRCHYFERCDDL